MAKKMNIMIAAGGTGGHLFPGIALAEVIAKKHPEAEILFLGTSRGLETRVLAKTPWKLVTLKSPALKNRRGLSRFFALLKLPFSLTTAIFLILRKRPRLMIGIGGYAAGPAVLAAALLRIPTAIVEPNALAGLTNRLLGKVVRRVFIALPEAASFFAPKKVRSTGTPVRSEMLHLTPKSRDDGKLAILCFGGSQGAKTLNRALVDALKPLGSERMKLRILHQTGDRENLQAIQQVYDRFQVEARVVPFIEQMAEAYAQADLVIARAGAGTIAELLTVAKPSILVPYPYAADDHQRANAEAMVRLGGAAMFLDQMFTGDRLASEMKRFLEEPWHLEKMEAALRQAHKGDAAEKIVEECWSLMEAA